MKFDLRARNIATGAKTLKENSEQLILTMISGMKQKTDRQEMTAECGPRMSNSPAGNEGSRIFWEKRESNRNIGMWNNQFFAPNGKKLTGTRLKAMVPSERPIMGTLKVTLNRGKRKFITVNPLDTKRKQNTPTHQEPDYKERGASEDPSQTDMNMEQKGRVLNIPKLRVSSPPSWLKIPTKRAGDATSQLHHVNSDIHEMRDQSDVNLAHNATHQGRDLVGVRSKSTNHDAEARRRSSYSRYLAGMDQEMSRASAPSPPTALHVTQHQDTQTWSDISHAHYDEEHRHHVASSPPPAVHAPDQSYLHILSDEERRLSSRLPTGSSSLVPESQELRRSTPRLHITGADTSTVDNQHHSQKVIGGSSGGHQHSRQHVSSPRRDHQHAHREEVRTVVHNYRSTHHDESDIDTHAHQQLQQGTNGGSHGHQHLREGNNVALLGAENAQRENPGSIHAHQHVHQEEPRGELRSYTHSPQMNDGVVWHEHQRLQQHETDSPSRGHVNSHQRQSGRNEELVRSLIKRYEDQGTRMAPATPATPATPSSFADDSIGGPLQPMRLHQRSGGAMASGLHSHTDREQNMASSFSQYYGSGIAIPTPIAPSDHECFWRERYLTLTAETRQLKAEMSTMAPIRSADPLPREQHDDDDFGLRAVTTILHIKDKDDIVINADLSPSGESSSER
ncbi:hypothetical protein F5Y18DRAFT_423887 [Xylariaceae sp. FL1019]|nr:hypothetical protein F5Y18DRAFT_423887 [Xylariaceae sp. FL1019]